MLGEKRRQFREQFSDNRRAFMELEAAREVAFLFTRVDFVQAGIASLR